jgi:hypothetical protein
VQDLQIVNMPQDCALLSIYHLVGHTPVIWVYYKTSLLQLCR